MLQRAITADLATGERSMAAWNRGRVEPIDAKMMRLSIPEPNSGCHLWLGRLDKDGYGVLWRSSLNWREGGENARAAPVAWEIEHGKPVPDGLQIDHLCNVKCCVNPAHLEAVTAQTNTIRRSARLGFRPRKDRRETCEFGHPIREYPSGRMCTECSIIRRRERRARLRAAGLKCN